MLIKFPLTFCAGTDIIAQKFNIEHVHAQSNIPDVFRVLESDAWHIPVPGKEAIPKTSCKGTRLRREAFSCKSGFSPQTRYKT